MTKQELMENFTMEQLADMVIEKEKQIDQVRVFGIFEKIKESGLFENPIKTFYEADLDIKQETINMLKKRLSQKESIISQINDILKKIFELKYDIKNPIEFENILKDKIEKYEKKIHELKVENAELHCEMQAMNVFCEGTPEEPIKVADMLISATYTRNKGKLEKNISKAFGNDSDTVTENMYSVSELRQIAEHLLVYCNHNESEGQ